MRRQILDDAILPFIELQGLREIVEDHRSGIGNAKAVVQVVHWHGGEKLECFPSADLGELPILQNARRCRTSGMRSRRV